MVDLDLERLERQVKAVYRDVAETPDGDFHFEMGRELARNLGYQTEELNSVPDAAIDSFAGVGYHFDLASIQPGNHVLDLGSGSGMDSAVAATATTHTGMVVGIDITDEQILKARDLMAAADMPYVHMQKSNIEYLPFKSDRFDVIISNGVINLSANKGQVFQEVYRVLESGGTLAISDIISEKPIPDSIKSDADLWAACIGGAMQIDRYKNIIEGPGLSVETIRENPKYEFRSDQAANACEQYGVKSISLLAEKD